MYHLLDCARLTHARWDVVCDVFLYYLLGKYIMVKIIALFNHKGGVGKTTTAFHLASRLRDNGKKVLLVDADSQCNLTSICVGFGNTKKNHKHSQKDQNSREQQSIESYYDNYDTIYSAIIDFLEGRILDIVPVAKTLKLYTHKIKDGSNLPPVSLLGGDVRFSEIEPRVTTAILLSSNPYGRTATHMKTPGVFRKLFHTLTIQHGFEYILLDMSPSLGVLNQCLLMNSDYFFIPTMPDYFSVQALDSIHKTLPKAYDFFSPFRVSNDSLNGYTLPGQPQFIGYVIQNFSLTRSKDHSQTENPESIIPAKPYQDWIDTIDNKIKEKVFPELKKHNMTIPQNKQIRSFIPSYNSLIARCHTEGKPAFHLRAATKIKKERRESENIKIKQFGNIFDNICEKLFALET